MRFTCQQRDLNNAIQNALRAVPTRSTIPALESLLIEAKNNRVTVTGYDGEMAICSYVDATVSEDGRYLFNAKRFSDIIKKLSDDVMTFFLKEGTEVCIECGESVVHLSASTAATYPELPAFDKDKVLVMEQKTFSDMVRATQYAASDDTARGIMQGIKVSVEDNVMEMVGIDGYRISLRREYLKGESPDMEFVVPKKAMRELHRIFNEKDSQLNICPTEKFILFETDNNILLCRLMEGTYLEYKGLLPDSKKTEIVLNRGEFARSVERAFLLIDENIRRYPITLTNVENTLLISTMTGIGSLQDKIGITFSGEQLDLDFDPLYFSDALKHLTDEEIKIEFNGTNGPCFIKPLEGDKYICMLLPLRR